MTLRDIDKDDSFSAQSTIHPALDKQHSLATTSHQLHEDVLHNIQVSTNQILDDLRAYHRTRNNLVLMVEDIPNDHDEELMYAMEAERTFAIQESFRQELEGQRTQDDEISQLQDDVLYHTNALTEQIIADFENLEHSSDDDCADEEPNVYNCDWWVEPPESSEDAPNSSIDVPHPSADLVDSDDLNENTDTEDGGEDVIELLKANMQLLTFLTKQSAIIARLRRRIVRLSTIVQDLTAQLNDTT